ncbi:hypothetical protein R9C00_04680 [Flammeovirgaceae bacterium SG7u.111]|nr:hypothetical protein [Flammeovirgaceae bacterium SG7u.132]WPO36739.1 hypothetical protein R9C00_04680 [Flammeovirgaceae bacterium SG7u.111]
MRHSLLKPVLIIILLSVWHTVSYGQESAPHTVSIPPSPTAASLGKFVDIPVANYTGTAQIGVPIYTVQEGSLSVPISLNYHSSGMKVGELPGWVGAGWALNAGGMISRVMRGKPDEIENGYFDVYDDVEYMRQTLTSPQGANGFDFENDLDLIDKFSRGEKDGEPDMFYINASGASGNFFIDPSTGEAYTIPYQKIKIDATYDVGPIGTISKFVVTTANGDKYYFGGNGYTETNSVQITQEQDPPDYISSWFLEKIVSADNKDIITFEYQQQEYGEQVESFVSHTRSDITFVHPWIASSSTATPCPLGFESESESLSTVEIPDAKKLSRIVFTDGYVEFNATNDRTDFPTSMKLNSIVVKDNQDNEFKNFELKYDYFNANRGTSPNPAQNLRLKLESVTETSNSVELPPYEFTYDESQITARNSYAQDKWGYFNGATSNSSLVPAMSGYGLYYLEEGADRETNPATLYGGSLIKMKYPTGGFTTFDYEPHQGQHEELVTTPFYILFGAFLEINADDEPVTSKTYNINNFSGESQAVQVKVLVDHKYEDDEGGYEERPKAHLTEIGNPDNTITYYEDGEYTFYFEEGKSYKLELEACCYQYDRVTVNITGYTQEEETVTDYIGGLRIKSMTFYDGNGLSPSMTKTYEYDSLELLNNPRYDYQQNRYQIIGSQQAGGGLEAYCTSFVRHSQNQSALGTGGSHVVYRKVTIKSIGNSDQGKTVHSYSFMPDQGARYYPFPPATSMDWLRGLSLKKLTMKSDNSTVAIETNDYNTGFDEPLNSHTMWGIKIGRTWTGTRFGRPYDNTDYHASTYLFETFPIYSRWLHLDESTQYTYSQDSQEFITNKSQFFYENPEHSQITKTITTNSKGEEYITENKYAADFAGTEFGSDQLRTNHMHSQVLKTETKKLIGGQETPLSKSETYFENLSGHVLPTKTLSYATANADPVQMDITYDEEEGNVTETQRLGDIPTTYIWGYDQTYPVAKIVNLSDDDPLISSIRVAIAARQFSNSDAKTDIDTDVAFLKSQLQTYINNPDYMVTIYTYKPLVGMTSQTDQNGYTTYYEYDDFGRLKLTRDQDGNILGVNEYHYSND